MSRSLAELEKKYGLPSDAEILAAHPGLDPRVLDLDPAIGISDDALVHPRFLLQMGWSQQLIANEFPEYARFTAALTKIGA